MRPRIFIARSLPARALPAFRPEWLRRAKEAARHEAYAAASSLMLVQMMERIRLNDERRDKLLTPRLRLLIESRRQQFEAVRAAAFPEARHRQAPSQSPEQSGEAQSDRPA